MVAFDVMVSFGKDLRGDDHRGRVRRTDAVVRTRSDRHREQAIGLDRVVGDGRHHDRQRGRSRRNDDAAARNRVVGARTRVAAVHEVDRERGARRRAQRDGDRVRLTLHQMGRRRAHRHDRQRRGTRLPEDGDDGRARRSDAVAGGRCERDDDVPVGLDRVRGQRVDREGRGRVAGAQDDGRVHRLVVLQRRGVARDRHADLRVLHRRLVGCDRERARTAGRDTAAAGDVHFRHVAVDDRRLRGGRRAEGVSGAACDREGERLVRLDECVGARRHHDLQRADTCRQRDDRRRKHDIGRGGGSAGAQVDIDRAGARRPTR